MSMFPISRCNLGYNNQRNIPQTTKLIFWKRAHLWENIRVIAYPWFYKSTRFLSFEGKKQGQTHLFFWNSPLFWMHKKAKTIREIALF